MKIVIVTDQPFPIGYAATNRIISYGKGFVENGCSVKVLCLRANQYPFDYRGKAERYGTYEGVSYEYTPGTSRRGKSFIQRRWLELRGLIVGLRLAVGGGEGGKFDAILLHSNSALYIVAFGLAAKAARIVYLQEKSELPFVLKNRSFPGRLYAKAYIGHIYKIFDGMLVETERLKEYFSSKVRRRARLLVVPATVDAREILEAREKKDGGCYIFYCGTIAREKKDGLHILIRAFYEVCTVYSDLRLTIAGKGLDPEMEFYRALVRELGLEDKVTILGPVPRGELVDLMKSAEILALAKERDEMQSGGLSSKVVEFLYTGKPVVLTDLGRITAHLRDKETVFFAEPDDVDSFARALRYVLEHPEEARRVGKRGQDFALRYFDYRLHTKRIMEFIRTIRTP